ncbi:MAG TPA: hypothetical protein VFL42_00550 [Terriglobales bacterium]|nr:hypothetical protein [Terriglobales bacterium]
MAGALAYSAVEISQAFTEGSSDLSTPIGYNVSAVSGNGMQLAANEMLAGPMSALIKKDGLAGELGSIYKARACIDCHPPPVEGNTSGSAEPRQNHRAQWGDLVKHLFTFLNSLCAL